MHFREPAERGFRHVFSPDDAAGGRARDGGAVPLRLPGLCRGMGRADAAAQLGVQATRLEEPQPRQLDLFAVGGAQQYARKAILDGTVDALREKYGEGVIRRARFTGADTVLAGGLSRERRTGITKPLDAE